MGTAQRCRPRESFGSPLSSFVEGSQWNRCEKETEADAQATGNDKIEDQDGDGESGDSGVTR